MTKRSDGMGNVRVSSRGPRHASGFFACWGESDRGICSAALPEAAGRAIKEFQQSCIPIRRNAPVDGALHRLWREAPRDTPNARTCLKKRLTHATRQRIIISSEQKANIVLLDEHNKGIPGHVPGHLFVDSKGPARNPGIPALFWEIRKLTKL